MPDPDVVADGHHWLAAAAAHRGGCMCQVIGYEEARMITTVVIALGAVALALLLVRVWAGRKVSVERASRPKALANAELIYMEKLFRIRAPIRLVAKVDRVYRLPGGSLVLVELKICGQDRPYLTDVIQLSAQRLAIEVQTGAFVEPYAFVSVLGAGRPGRFRSHRVRLLDAAAVVQLHRRREAILAMRLAPAHAASEAACRGCALKFQVRSLRRSRVRATTRPHLSLSGCVSPPQSRRQCRANDRPARGLCGLVVVLGCIVVR
ncbi:hypothetical protein [Verminephrobacter eiseniae]|uniref:hypothetical protein n=1 Tax=Verminephrobacter eiseniae TaxID=364317 RepID=UPI002237BD93|nr:hypothetical protein [Verminephrobacter eiseniae]